MPAEHLLDQQRPRDQRGQIQAGQRDRREQRVAQRMAPHGAAPTQSLRDRRAHPVARHHLEQRAALVTRDRRRGQQRERADRKHEMPEPIERALRRTACSRAARDRRSRPAAGSAAGTRRGSARPARARSRAPSTARGARGRAIGRAHRPAAPTAARRRRCRARSDSVERESHEQQRARQRVGDHVGDRTAEVRSSSRGRRAACSPTQRRYCSPSGRSRPSDARHCWRTSSVSPRPS